MNAQPFLKPATGLLSLLLLAGCALDPVDRKPEWKTPEGSAADSTSPLVTDTWWKAFGDPGLDLAVEKALTASPDMDAAYARVRAARAAAGLADSGFWPTLNTSASYRRTRISANEPNPFGGFTFGNYAASAAVTYEVDLWGRVRNAASAAESEYRSSHADLAAARLLVVGETVKLWLDLRQAKAELSTLDAEYGCRKRSYELLAAREDAGIIGGDEVSRAKLAAAQAKYELESVGLKVGLLRNALAAALGELPGASGLPEPSDTLPEALPAAPASLPSGLLKSRPDIASADLRLDAALAREGAARASYYPNLTLSATGGFSSMKIGDLLTRDSRTWGIGPAVSLPIFTGGRNDAEMENSRARFDAEWAAYRRSVLTAFRETEDSLLTLSRLAEQEKLVAALGVAAGETLTFANARFEKGLSSNLEVTLAERDTLAARRELIRIRFERLRATANLARAVGGGWDRDTSIEASHTAFEERLAKAAEAKAE